MKSFLRIAGAAALTLGLVASASASSLTGAGSSFMYPLMSKWVYAYHNSKGVQVNYQSIGSGAGMKQLLAKTVNFAGSDAFMSAEQMQEAGGTIIHLPATMGAVTITYNVPGVSSGIKLDAGTLAGIFLGNITNWNDAALADLNPGVSFPDKAITVVHRADSSGTSAIFTDYLTKVSTQWAAKVGKGTSVKWPAGVGAKGNEAVAGVVRQIPGSIGYCELAYVLQNKMSFAKLKNKEGEFVTPSLESVSAAADGAMKKMPADFRVSFTNAAGQGAYPISGFAWFMVYPNVAGSGGKDLVDFLSWATGDGQKMAASLDYAPLPASLQAKIQAKIATIKY